MNDISEWVFSSPCYVKVSARKIIKTLIKHGKKNCIRAIKQRCDDFERQKPWYSLNVKINLHFFNFKATDDCDAFTIIAKPIIIHAEECNVCCCFVFFFFWYRNRTEQYHFGLKLNRLGLNSDKKKQDVHVVSCVRRARSQEERKNR